MPVFQECVTWWRSVFRYVLAIAPVKYIPNATYALLEVCLMTHQQDQFIEFTLPHYNLLIAMIKWLKGQLEKADMFRHRHKPFYNVLLHLYNSIYSYLVLFIRQSSPPNPDVNLNTFISTCAHVMGRQHATRHHTPSSVVHALQKPNLKAKMIKQRGVTPTSSVLQSATTVEQQVNGQGSFKTKNNGQTFLVDGQNYMNKAVHKNINKRNKVKGQD